MKYIGLLSMALIIASCSQKESYSDGIKKISKEDFLISKNIEADTVPIKDYNLNWKIIVSDSFLIIQKKPFQLKGKQTFFSVYHKTKLDYLGGIGVKGEGPWHDEWSYIMQSGQVLNKNGQSLLWVYHNNYGFAALLNITQTLLSNSPKPIIDTTIVVDANQFAFTNLTKINNNLISDTWMSDTPQSLLKTLNLKTKNIYYHPLTPTMQNIDVLPSEVISSLYTSSFKKHPKNGKIAQTMKLFNRINFFDDDLNLTKSIVDGENWKNEFYDAKEINIESNFFEGRIDGYNGLEVSDKFVFALKIRKENQENSELRVFDWQGNPAFLINIKNPISFSMSFDEDTNTLYALDSNNDLLLKFDLTVIIKEWQNSLK